jgi:LPS-assembly protein
MPPVRQCLFHVSNRSRRSLRAGAAAVALAFLFPGATALAQDAAPTGESAAEGVPVAFEADVVEYAEHTDTVTARGNVVLRREGKSLKADRVTWDRKSGKIVANGNIRMIDEDGNQLFTDTLELTDEFKEGAMTNMLLALREGGRLAANSGTRNESGHIILSHAAYSACEVEDSQGCPKTPSWRIIARQVDYDPQRKLVKFRGARLELFGIKLLPVPGLALATDGRAISGLLIPDFRLSPSNGAEVSETYYYRLSDNRDIAATAYAFTKAPPMVSVQYRALTTKGAYQITGYATESERIPIDASTTNTQRNFRGYLFANGRFQLSPNWSITGSIRWASDRTFLRRYNISRDDTLRSTINAERIDDNSYLSISGWAFQTMREGKDQGVVPIALPAFDYRRRFSDPLLGGKFELQLNSLAIMRTNGQDTQRAFASVRWDLTRVTGMGQEITFTGLLRGDVYHSDYNNLTSTAIYRGLSGWQTRGVATAAIDVKWPFVGKFMGGGTQVFTPRVQLVASPTIRNLEVPNEDSRAIELEDSNLFALNRFPGYDRVEDGVRVTYGLDWQAQWPRWQIKTTIGQSYRISSTPNYFPDGTGLASRTSDIVGRTEVRYRDFVKLTHRFRLDKDSLAFRRNEIDLTLGSHKTYLELGYLRLNRDIPPSPEALADREELRVAARIAFARYWSLFGAAVINLTNRNEDPTNNSDGFQPLRTRIGIAYQDDCMEFSFNWRRDFVAPGDVRRGNTFQVHFAFRNIGFR